MRTITNIDNIDKCNTPTYVLVNWVGEINKIIGAYPNKDMIFRLQLNNIDEELLTMLESMPYKIEIVYTNPHLEEDALVLLSNYLKKIILKYMLIIILIIKVHMIKRY